MITTNGSKEMAKFETTSAELKNIIEAHTTGGQNQRIEVELFDGRIIHTNAPSLNNYHLNNFHNWHCEGYGSEELFIDHTGEVYGGRCLVKKLGHASQVGLSLLEDGVPRCPRTSCMCTTDVMLTKHNLNLEQASRNIENQ